MQHSLPVIWLTRTDPLATTATWSRGGVRLACIRRGVRRMSPGRCTSVNHQAATSDRGSTRRRFHRPFSRWSPGATVSDRRCRQNASDHPAAARRDQEDGHNVPPEPGSRPPAACVHSGGEYLTVRKFPPVRARSPAPADEGSLVQVQPGTEPRSSQKERTTMNGSSEPATCSAGPTADSSTDLAGKRSMTCEGRRLTVSA